MAEYEGDQQADALLAALLDEPLPPEALEDEAFMTEHRSAVADVATLREQLRIMGDALAAESERPERSPNPEPLKPARTKPVRAKPVRTKPARTEKPVKPAKPSWRRRYGGVALGALALGMGTAMLGGLVWLGASGGVGSSSGASDKSAAQQGSNEDSGNAEYSPEMHIACSKVLVEGTVRSITPRDDGDVRVVLEVKRYYRPERSVAKHPTISVTLLGSARKDLKAGDYTLVRVPVYPEDRQDWEVGWGVGDARKDIVDALPGARGLECSGPGR
ncbi:hypothetical protein [Streptomyces sporangiiformans]|uniref:Uncharacterized protein n=1 Tax=Streptomyces sporangiiformans TaxID=2315329 RepID=A0A505DHJ7_9ACTN|nr:hypothetical protein [Streptomyces sporangiiformans]TPQ17499.1 hypothetical protein FGD71_036035 [Streptomyces sporangiiformans]